MTKALRSYPEHQRQKVAERRLIGMTHGNGFHAAKDYYDKKKLRYPGQMGVMQTLAKIQEEAIYDEHGYHQPDSGATQHRRHPGAKSDNRDESSKPQRRSNRGRRPTAAQRRAAGVGMPPVRRKFPKVGGGRGPSKAAFTKPHPNRPRLVGAMR